MKPTAMGAAVLAIGLSLASCTTDEFARTDGVTTTAGDSIAANTVMQMVDPWPMGVQDTDLRVPANRPSGGGESAGGESTTGGAGGAY